MLPEPNFPVKPNEFIGRQVHLDAFAEALEVSKVTGRMASFAVLGDWGIGKSSLLLKLAAASSDSRILPVTLSVTKDITDYMKFAEALCDRLAHALLASDSLATRFRTEIDNWKLTKVSVGALTKPHLRARAWIYGSWRNGSLARRSAIRTFLPSSAESFGVITERDPSQTRPRSGPLSSAVSNKSSSAPIWPSSRKKSWRFYRQSRQTVQTNSIPRHSSSSSTISILSASPKQAF